MRFFSALQGVIAGSLDVISLLQLGLFTAHITGNLALLILHALNGGTCRLAPMLSIPVFIAALALTRILARDARSSGIDRLRPLLLLECLLLLGCVAVAIAGGPRVDPNASTTVVAAMLAVAAMAVQSGVASLRGAPPTTVVTGNVTHLTLDAVEILRAREPQGADDARGRVRQTWPAIAGFAAGCGLGAAGLAAVGRWSLVLPAGLAVVALAIVAWPSRHAAHSEAVRRWRMNRRAR